MRKGIIYLIIFNLARFIILLLASKEALVNLNANLYGLTSQANIAQLLTTNTIFENPFFTSNSINAIILSTLMYVVLQLVFLMLLGLIVRNNKKYLIWIILISSIIISPWMNLDFYKLLFGILWLGSIYALYRAVFNSRQSYWLTASILLGLGFALKSFMAAIPIGVFVFLIFSTKYRFYIFSYKPYLMVAIGLVISFLFSNEWFGLSLNIQQSKAFESHEVTGFHPSYFLNFVISQFIILMPVLFIGMWWLLFKYFGRIVKKPNQVNPEFWFLLCFFIPMYLGVYIISFFYTTPTDQLLPIYLIGLIIFGKLMKKRWVYWHITLNLILYVILICSPLFL